MITTIFHNLATLDVFSSLMIGVIAGLVIGALPGLSGNMALALLLPITYTMKAESAIIMMLAIYTASMTGGSISACLLHTPGTPSNAATAIDGYPMTLRGEGIKALSISITSSMIGGTLSAVALLIIAPPLAKVSLMFSEPENFLLAIFGLTVIGSLAGDDMVKGLLMAAAGLLLATVGIDNITGMHRFTFGSLRLLSGVQLVPTMIGLFSIPRVLSICEKPKEANKSLVMDKGTKLSGSVFLKKSEYMRILPVILLSSIVGIFVGILPGAGGSIGSWLAYDNAKKMSKHKEEFGHGSIEGLAAVESGNNAVTGGAFIPLLTLSIPGSPAAAIVLGALMIHGLVPGNRLFTQQAETTYTILVGFLLANLVMGIIGLIFARWAVYITRIPNSILLPCVLVLSFIGAYAINATMFDVWTAIFFGVLGYIMEKNNLPAAPLILGLILGGDAESGLRLSMVMARGSLLKYFMGRTPCVILMVIILISLLYPIITGLIKKRKERGGLNAC